MIFRRALALLFFAVCLGSLVTLALPKAPLSISASYAFGGQQYQTLIELPRGSAQPRPLVLALHGYGESIQDFRDLTGLYVLAEIGYPVLFVQGLPDGEGMAHWNANLVPENNADVDALRYIVRRVQARYDLGFEYVAAGYSNGGFMAYTLACAGDERLVSIASVAGTMSGHDWETCAPERAVAVLQVHGDADDVVPIDGSIPLEGGWGGAPEIGRVLGYWADHALSVPRAAVKASRRAVRVDYLDDVGGLWVSDLRLLGHGHDWPNPRDVGLDVYDVIDDFFADTAEPAIF